MTFFYFNSVCSKNESIKRVFVYFLAACKIYE